MNSSLKAKLQKLRIQLLSQNALLSGQLEELESFGDTLRSHLRQNLPQLKSNSSLRVLSPKKHQIVQKKTSSLQRLLDSEDPDLKKEKKRTPRSTYFTTTQPHCLSLNEVDGSFPNRPSSQPPYQSLCEIPCDLPLRPSKIDRKAEDLSSLTEREKFLSSKRKLPSAPTESTQKDSHSDQIISLIERANKASSKNAKGSLVKERLEIPKPSKPKVPQNFFSPSATLWSEKRAPQSTQSMVDSSRPSLATNGHRELARLLREKQEAAKLRGALNKFF